MNDQTAIQNEPSNENQQVDVGNVPINLTMNVSTVEYLLRILGQQPHDQVAGLISGLRHAAGEQVRAHLEAQTNNQQAAE